MKVQTKCHNYSGCLLAYRGEEIELEAGEALVCPECGKPLKISPPGRSKAASLMSTGIVIAALLASIAYFYSKHFAKPAPAPITVESTPSKSKISTTPKPAPARAEAVKIDEEPTPVIPPSVPPTPVTPAAPEPIAVVTAPAKIDLNPATSENTKVKNEVLERIDVMPNLTRANKDKLYASVQRARSMGKVLTIPFASGKTTLAAADILALKGQLDSPALLKLRDDPTSVFVLLGYADPTGDKQKNVDFSQARADAVLAAMRDKCGVVNVMHAVAMGGSTLLDAQNLEKNRTVEVWAVLP